MTPRNASRQVASQRTATPRTDSQRNVLLPRYPITRDATHGPATLRLAALRNAMI